MITRGFLFQKYKMVFPINVIDLPCYMVVFLTIDQGPFKVVLGELILLLLALRRRTP